MLFLFLLLSEDHGSAEVGKMVMEGQAWARSCPGLGVLHGYNFYRRAESHAGCGRVREA